MEKALSGEEYDCYYYYYHYYCYYYCYYSYYYVVDRVQPS